MRHATWSSIEASPVAMGLYRRFRRLPQPVRASARWLAMPRWQLATLLVRHKAGNAVIDGPFIGMKLELSPVSSRHLLGYILGTQELELRAVMERVIARGYRHVVNVGAADGYYAVGLARRLPQAKVFAFEALEDMHAVIRRAAKLNGVDHRLRIGGMCLFPNLEAAVAEADGQALVLVDIEGAELQLLDPVRVASLRHADILVETHDAFAPGCTDMLAERFAPSHRVERITARPRTLADFPRGFLGPLVRFMPEMALELMNERRTGLQHWLFLEAKHTPAIGAGGRPAPQLA